MRRREIITLVGGAAATWPLAARAQQTSSIARVGVLAPPIEGPVTGANHPLFLAELRKLGFTEGQNLLVDYRSIEQGMAKAFADANELAAAKANVLFANGPELPLQAAAAVRPVLPIVMVAINFDPIARGYVSSLAQPGANITGIVSRQLELSAKQLALLAEAFPERRQVGVLWDEQSVDQFQSAERAAPSLGLSLRSHKLERPPYDYAGAFRALAQDGAQMVLVMSGPLFSRQKPGDLPANAQIAQLAIAHQLPTMFIFPHYVHAGGLMSYGVDYAPMMRRAASFVAKILRGAKPADLPVEQATHFQFVLNLKTAKAIGVTLPTSILLRADEVIE
jgi:putative ABC transport system substrate-binding protein